MKLKHLLFSSLMLLSAGTAWADVRINAINFPDANFRSYLTNQSYGSDGLLTDAEIAEIKSLMLSSKNIQNLNGIKNFTTLQYLSCDGNLLTSLDVSGCESLIELDCSNNQLTSLDVSGCTALTSIICANNKLKGDAMNKLINSLPIAQDGGLYAINSVSDGNAMNIDQVKRVNAKGWIAYALDEKWNEYTGAIPIDEENFPDKKFRNYLLSQSYGSDGKLTGEEIAGVTGINVSGTYGSPGTISSLKGIEFFTALKSLACSYNQLTSLDVSKNTALTMLYCYNNQLTSLDVSKNTALTELDCYNNQFTSLDVSKNTELWYLSCGGNQLTSLDVSKNTALTKLVCGNQLTSLDVSKNTALTELNCAGNQLASLDVSGCTALTRLYCNNNQLTSLDVSKNTALTYLYCFDNQLTSLDLSKNTSLEDLCCYGNQLTSLDVSKNTEMRLLYCFDNQLTSLDVSKNTKLTGLGCYQNRIKGKAMDALVASLPTVSWSEMQVIYNENEQNVMTTTQVAAAKAKGWRPYYYDGTKWKIYAGVDPVLENIAINEENFPDANFRKYLLSQSYGVDGVLTDAEIAKVISIDVSSKSIQSLKGIEFFTALTELNCRSNQLTSLDVSKNTALKGLYCTENQLTSLDVSKNTALEKLWCDNNQLTSLDVSKNTALDVLSCDGNPLTSLDVSKNTALTSLSCGGNPLTSLDVSKNTALKELYCPENQLTSLDLSKNTALKWLWCNNNQLTSLDVSKNTALKGLCCWYNQLTSLDVSKNTALTGLSCENNQLISLDVSKNTALTSLNCSSNRLTSLDVSKNTALTGLYCYQNRIKGAAMDALVASLRVNNYNYHYNMQVIYYENEQNVMTTTQVAAAKAKGWIPYYTEDGTNWKEYAGVAPSTGVNNVEASADADSAPWYTINGTLLTGKPTAAGIYIHGGKKVIVK